MKKKRISNLSDREIREELLRATLATKKEVIVIKYIVVISFIIAALSALIGLSAIG